MCGDGLWLMSHLSIYKPPPPQWTVRIILIQQWLTFVQNSLYYSKTCLELLSMYKSDLALFTQVQMVLAPSRVVQVLHARSIGLRHVLDDSNLFQVVLARSWPFKNLGVPSRVFQAILALSTVHVYYPIHLCTRPGPIVRVTLPVCVRPCPCAWPNSPSAAVLVPSALPCAHGHHFTLVGACDCRFAHSCARLKCQLMQGVT